MSVVAGVALDLDPRTGGAPRRATRDGLVASGARLRVVPDVPLAEEPAVEGPRAPLRLTRRGRALVLGLLVVLLTAGTVGLGAARAGSASTTPSGRQAKVVVAEGDTLWTIAGTVSPNSNRRDTVDRIVKANHLHGSRVEPGQQLVVPLDTP